MKRRNIIITLIVVVFISGALVYFYKSQPETKTISVYNLKMSETTRRELEDLQQSFTDENDFVYTQDENHGVDRILWWVHGIEPNFSQNSFLKKLSLLSEETIDFLFSGNGIFIRFDSPMTKNKRQVVDVTPALLQIITENPIIKDFTGDITGRWTSEEEYNDRKVKSETQNNPDGTFEDKFYIYDMKGKLVKEQTERGTWKNVKNYHVVRSKIEGDDFVFQDVYKILSVTSQTAEYRSLRLGVIFKRRKIN